MKYKREQHYVKAKQLCLVRQFFEKNNDDRVIRTLYFRVLFGKRWGTLLYLSSSS